MSSIYPVRAATVEELNNLAAEILNAEAHLKYAQTICNNRRDEWQQLMTLKENRIRYYEQYNLLDPTPMEGLSNG